MQISVLAGYFLYAEQLNARRLGGVALVVAGTLLLRLP
jgi:multidrug transporter EmrE-like cation transporter